MNLSAADEATVVDDPEDAPLALPRRRLEEDAEMDITPMIDITFLLLIFFLVASRINSEAQVSLPKALYGTAVANKDSIVITLAHTGGQRAAVYAADGKDEGKLLTAANLEDEQELIVAYVRAGLEAKKRHVLLKAEKNVKSREVGRVARAVGQAGDVPLYVAVLEQQ